MPDLVTCSACRHALPSPYKQAHMQPYLKCAAYQHLGRVNSDTYLRRCERYQPKAEQGRLL
jgi:hypothetical protein